MTLSPTAFRNFFHGGENTPPVNEAPVVSPGVPEEKAQLSPSTPGIKASYVDMWANGIVREAKLEFDNVDTIRAVARAMEAVDRRRVDQAEALASQQEFERAQELLEMRQFNIVAYLQTIEAMYEDYNGSKKPTIHGENARQTRRFMGQVARDQLPGLTPDMQQDMQFLDQNMYAENHVPIVQPGESAGPNIDSPYATEDRNHWSGNTSAAA